MPAITQTVPNFLGGVSRQTDDKKLINQVSECINGYPDPTFGLLKRPGMEHINVLKKADGNAFTKAELAGAAWFYIDRDVAGSYVGCIKGTDIFVWTKGDGTFCTVDNQGAAYLTGTKQDDYHFRSVQDVTVITNRKISTAMQAAGTFVPNAVATLKLNSVTDGAKYTVTLQSHKVSVTATNSTTFDDMLIRTENNDSDGADTEHLIDGVRKLIKDRQTANDPDFDGTWCLESYVDSIVIKRFNTPNTDEIKTDYTVPDNVDPVSFTIDANGGVGNTGLDVFQDSVSKSGDLSAESYHGHHVKVRNTNSADDDYYLQFVAFDDTRGKGYWRETLARDASPGFNAATMPFQLKMEEDPNDGPTSFTFKAIPWEGRLVGDDNSNPTPSFVGQKITSTFFYNNRFGMLSEDNIILGTANDSFNFFVKSALTQVDSDPIDLNVASVQPVVLTDVLPSPQGLLLFSARQQFQLLSASATKMTPNTTIIRSIANYEMTSNISPVDVGTTAAFLTKVPGYAKLFTMQLRDLEQSPLVVDISKVVLEWLPDTIDALSVSPQNSVIMLTDHGSNCLYLYRFYNNGEKDLFQAWVKWELPTTIEAAEIVDDDVIIVSQHEDEYTLSSITLDAIPTGNVTTNGGIVGTPCLDMATRPVKPHTNVNAVVYDETNDITKIYVPYTPIDTKEATMYLAVPEADVGTDAALDADEGYYAPAAERKEPSTNYRYFEVKGNFTDYADGIIVGYPLEFEVTLPRLYYRPDDNKTDFTASLTVSRIKFSVGKSGAIEFIVKADGANEWKPVEHTSDGDRYSADTNPVKFGKDLYVITLPLHQRNTNFELKLTSKFPYPVSLVSMAWEGNYSPRFYRRA